jgi:biopolymer transport protein ExbB
MKCRLLTLAGLVLSAISVSAAPADSTIGAPVDKSFIEMVLAGGYTMYVLLLISVILVLFILVFLATIRRNAVVSDKFMNAAEAMIRRRDYLGLVAYCHRQNECIARVMQKSLEFLTKNPNAPFIEVRSLAEAEGSRQAGTLTSRITYLADIAAIAPMVGLLGTVIGMIKSFIHIAGNSGQAVRQMELAGGVSEALIATASGLVIAIPALAFYSIFRGRVFRYVSELEAAAAHLMAILNGQIERQPTAPAYAPPVRGREDFAMPTPSPLGAERPDLHGI